MLVYHFINAQYGLEGIQKRRLKISRLMELNDPFEFLGVDLSDREFRKALKKTKIDISKSRGILCFSESWRNPVLWGHYADKHKGLCLGFEVPRPDLGKVKYQDSRLPLPKEIDETFMQHLLFTKFKHWDYEQEYRVYIQLEDEVEGTYYSNFSDQLKLKRVIVGEQCNITRPELYDALGELRSDVETFKARAGFTKFEVVRQKNNAKWT